MAGRGAAPAPHRADEHITTAEHTSPAAHVRAVARLGGGDAQTAHDSYAIACQRQIVEMLCALNDPPPAAPPAEALRDIALRAGAAALLPMIDAIERQPERAPSLGDTREDEVLGMVLARAARNPGAGIEGAVCTGLLECLTPGGVAPWLCVAARCGAMLGALQLRDRDTRLWRVTMYAQLRLEALEACRRAIHATACEYVLSGDPARLRVGASHMDAVPQEHWRVLRLDCVDPALDDEFRARAGAAARAAARAAVAQCAAPLPPHLDARLHGEVDALLALL